MKILSDVFHSTVLKLFLLSATLFLVGFSIWYVWNQTKTLDNKIQQVNSLYEQVQVGFDDSLYMDHLRYIEKMQITQSEKEIQAQYDKLKSEGDTGKLAKIDEVFSLYKNSLTKIDRNKGVNLDTQSVTGQLNDWGQKFLNQDFDGLKTSITAANEGMDTQYQGYLASIAPPPPPPAPTPAPQPAPQPPMPQPAEGYSYQTVSTSRGRFGVHLIKMPLSAVTVRTVTANQTDCVDGCPTKSLATYVQENGAYGGINGTYFAPPDYSSSAGKINSYTFAVYNSNLGKWLNEKTLAWGGIGWGLATFSGHTAKFYADIASYDKSAVTAGISNFPTLLSGGNIAYTSNQIDTYQTNNKSPRGFIGTDGTHIYLGLVNGATVPDEAVVAQTLGVKDALNIDGGGSSAMYIGGAYKVGPGRSLPNAILLMR